MLVCIWDDSFCGIQDWMKKEYVIEVMGRVTTFQKLWKEEGKLKKFFLEGGLMGKGASILGVEVQGFYR